MTYFSPKSTLLAGVSAVVLATTVGVSGALAQQVRTATATANGTYASGAVGSTGIAGARSGDILRINQGVTVTINKDSDDDGTPDDAGQIEINSVIGGAWYA